MNPLRMRKLPAGMGIRNECRQLDYVQRIACSCGGGKSLCRVCAECRLFCILSVPVARWNRRYVAVTSCCGARTVLPEGVGEGIEAGQSGLLEQEIFSLRTDAEAREERVSGGRNAARLPMLRRTETL